MHTKYTLKPLDSMNRISHLTWMIIYKTDTIQTAHEQRTTHKILFVTLSTFHHSVWESEREKESGLNPLRLKHLHLFCCKKDINLRVFHVFYMFCCSVDRSTVALMIRKVQYAPDSEVAAQSVEISKEFAMSDKPLHVKASLDKEVASHLLLSSAARTKHHSEFISKPSCCI